ncbi:unnamed protein product [Ascophyllum nodosum]
MVVVAKGYRVVPQRLACGAQGFRHVHLKEHSGSFKAKVSKKRGGDKEVIFAKGTTLFIGNIDDQAGGRLCRKTIEDRLRRAFSTCGIIAHVHVSPAGDLRQIPEAKKGSATLSRYAHVCFSSPKGVQQALALEEIPSGALVGKGSAGEDGDAEDQSGDGGKEREEAPDLETENRDENGDQTCGYAALIQRHQRNFPPLQALQAEVDSTMARFEEDEAAEAARRKAKLDNPVDDDGFVTVTHKRKRGRNSGIPSHSDGTADAPIKKRKGSDKLTDFYRFQMRESRREQLAALRSKFEQDKARVAKMKQQRKFKPF